MGIQATYNQWAANYDTDRNLTRDLDAEVTRKLLGTMQVRAALETGCGTGKNSRFLASIAQHLLALDFSAAMIQQAQARDYARRPLFTLADLSQPWPCAPHSVELVTCNLVLEHIADLSAYFAQAQRVLAPTGRLFISELHPFKQYVGKQAVYQQDGQEVKIAAYVHHVSDFMHTAQAQGFSLLDLREWWHEDDVNKPPRLISFLFEKVGASVIR